MSTTPNSGEDATPLTPACDQVMAIPELVEAIIASMPPELVLDLKAAYNIWRDTIRRSTIIRRRRVIWHIMPTSSYAVYAASTARSGCPRYSVSRPMQFKPRLAPLRDSTVDRDIDSFLIYDARHNALTDATLQNCDEPVTLPRVCAIRKSVQWKRTAADDQYFFTDVYNPIGVKVRDLIHVATTLMNQIRNAGPVHNEYRTRLIRASVGSLQ
jgi:hypothetical protein